MKTRLPLVALATAGVTLAAAIVALNFTYREKRIGQRIRRLYSAADPDFGRAMGVLLGPAIVGGNRVEVLLNGHRIFPAMLAAIQDARTSINFESFIYWSGTIGRQFAEALAERARAGVKVHVLLDWVGSNKMDQALLDEMERAGVRSSATTRCAGTTSDASTTAPTASCWWSTAGSASPAAWASPTSGRATRRTRTTGATRTSASRARRSRRCRRCSSTTGSRPPARVLHGEDYFPPLEPARAAAGADVHSSPEGGSESMQLMYLLAIAAASAVDRPFDAYFVPDDLTLDARRRR